MIKIEIKTKGKERINADVVHTINEAMENIEYKLCPNCKDGELQAKKVVIIKED